MKIGVAQMCSGEDPWDNLTQIKEFIERAQDQGVDLLCFPENALYRGRKSRRPQEVIFSAPSQKPSQEGTDFHRALFSLIQESGLSVSLGSLLESSDHPDKPYNAHWIFKKGVIEPIRYQKINLFSFTGDTHQYREADDIAAGKRPVSAEYEDWRIGLSVCYDLRFPELFREYTFKHKTNLLLVPSAFTRETGEVHWHALMRARAIENLSYVAAAAQWGAHFAESGQQLYCYGHAVIIDPWGRVLAEGPAEGDALLTAEIQTREVEKMRQRFWS